MFYSSNEICTNSLFAEQLLFANLNILAQNLVIQLAQVWDMIQSTLEIHRSSTGEDLTILASDNPNLYTCDLI